MQVSWGARMFTDRLSWRAARAVSLAAVLLCAASGSQAASIAMPTQHIDDDTTTASINIAPMVAAKPASFAERFDGAQTSIFANLLASPTYRAPVFRTLPQYTAAGDGVEGSASTYDPTDPTDRDSGDMQTASGEAYDPEGWTAAIRTDLRDQFGGVRFGKNYQKTFALVEANGKRLIVQINDVGPLRPGRVIDLNRRAMQFFDPTMTIGVLQDVKVTPLAGDTIAAGPVEDRPAFASYFVAVWQ